MEFHRHDTFIILPLILTSAAGIKQHSVWWSSSYLSGWKSRKDAESGIFWNVWNIPEFREELGQYCGCWWSAQQQTPSNILFDGVIFAGGDGIQEL